MISLLRKTIPDKVRIPAFVMVIATFTTIVEMVMRKFVPALYNALGLFIPLIVVNCILLARRTLLPSIRDGFRVGRARYGDRLPFINPLGAVRELIGAGSVFGYEIGFANLQNERVCTARERVFVYGLSMAAFNAVVKR